MNTQTGCTATPNRLLQMSMGVVIQQTLFAAAKLGIADLLHENRWTATRLAAELNVNEHAVIRMLRLLASQGIFEETSMGVFSNTPESNFLRSGIPGSIRSILILRGSSFLYAPFEDILYSIATGQPAREKLYGKRVFEYLEEHPAVARIFDDGMTNLTELVAPSIASSYDFGVWGSLADVGGGNGVLLAAILKGHAELTGVLCDLPHVLDRARERGFLTTELKQRSDFRPCDFLREVTSGYRAYMMKSVIHDWDDDSARQILTNCRRAVPRDGVLLLVEVILPERDSAVYGRVLDISMMILTGGKERTLQEYRDLLAESGFSVNQVIPSSSDLSIIEALPIPS